MERWSVRPAESRVQSLLIESGPATVPCCDQQSVADVANKLQNLNLKKSSPLHLDLLGTLSQHCNKRKSLGHLRVRSYWQPKEEVSYYEMPICKFSSWKHHIQDTCREAVHQPRECGNKSPFCCWSSNEVCAAQLTDTILVTVKINLYHVHIYLQSCSQEEHRKSQVTSGRPTAGKLPRVYHKTQCL